MILLIDNYDSFTWNLVQRLGEIAPGVEILVRRNDQISCDEIAALAPTHLVISPGPCTPTEAGVSCDAVRRFAGRMPILGVCLGHQAIGQVFGGTIVRAGRLIELDVDDSVTDAALEEMAAKLLDNQVIENYRIDRVAA